MENCGKVFGENWGEAWKTVKKALLWAWQRRQMDELLYSVLVYLHKTLQSENFYHIISNQKRNFLCHNGKSWWTFKLTMEPKKWKENLQTNIVQLLLRRTYPPTVKLFSIHCIIIANCGCNFMSRTHWTDFQENCKVFHLLRLQLSSLSWLEWTILKLLCTQLRE